MSTAAKAVPVEDSATSPAHRRRAALSVLQPLLGHEGSIQVLARLHGQLRSDTVADLIGFVDAVAADQQLDDIQRRRSYASLHAALRGDGALLPPDPWPAMQAVWDNTDTARPSTMPSAAPKLWPTPESAQPIVDAPQAVFAALLASVVHTLQTSHAAHWVAVRQAGLTQFERAHVSPLAREAARAVWHQAAHASPANRWRLAGQPNELSELVHRLYLALCEVLGPVSADEVLTRATRQAMQVPEARSFPPGRLL